MSLTEWLRKLLPGLAEGSTQPLGDSGPVVFKGRSLRRGPHWCTYVAQNAETAAAALPQLHARAAAADQQREQQRQEKYERDVEFFSNNKTTKGGAWRGKRSETKAAQRQAERDAAREMSRREVKEAREAAAAAERQAAAAVKQAEKDAAAAERLERMKRRRES